MIYNNFYWLLANPVIIFGNHLLVHKHVTQSVLTICRCLGKQKTDLAQKTILESVWEINGKPVTDWLRFNHCSPLHNVSYPW